MRHPVRHLLQILPSAKSATTRLVALLLMASLFIAQPAAAQIPLVPLIGYDQTIPGEVTSPSGTEHRFTGCEGEIVGVSVTANDFAPRIEIYEADSDTPLASATAANNSTGNRTVVLENVELPASGVYTLLVSGRSRGDRGGYSVTLQGTTTEGDFLRDGKSTLDLVYGQSITGTLLANRGDEWNFRGCAGDEIVAHIASKDIAPKMTLFYIFHAAPSATSVPEADDERGDAEQGESIRYTLPDTGVYSLSAGGVTQTSDYRLSLTLEGRSTPATPTQTPVVISELSPTPTPTNTSVSGPRVRRGTPVPRAGTPTPSPTTNQGPTPTFTPTPTLEFAMPGLGESAFRVLDVSRDHGPVNHVAYSPDGNILATAGEDGTVHAWDAFSGKLMQTMEGHTERVNYVAFSPDDEYIASAAEDGTVRLWDQAGDEVATLEMPDNGVNSVAFSPSSTELVATTDAGDVWVWGVDEARVGAGVRLELEGNQGPVYHALFSPNGTKIAVGDGVGMVRIYDAFSGELEDSLPVNAGPGSGDPILSISFTPSSTVIVVGGVIGVNAASIQVWDLTTGDKITEFEGHREWGSIAVLSPVEGEPYLLSAGRAEPGHDGPVTAQARIWNVETGNLAIALVGYPSSVIAAAFRPDGDEIMTSDGMNVYIWPAAMIQVLAASLGEAVGVQIPAPTVTPTPPVSQATATPTVTPTISPTVTRAPTATTIPTATLTPTTEVPNISLQIFCTVITDRLNLRSGPGTNFNPPLAVIETGEILVVVGRNADSSWLQVAVLDDNLDVKLTGWVSADFVFCVGEIADAPVVQ